MEKRKYTFYDRYQKVKYANITAEELEVLNISYNKEHYMFDQQHQRNNTVLFCGLESENGCATDFIADSGRDIASDITTEIFFKELFSDLTEKEKKIVSDYFIMGKQVKETAEELGISTRQVMISVQGKFLCNNITEGFTFFRYNRDTKFERGTKHWQKEWQVSIKKDVLSAEYVKILVRWQLSKFTMDVMLW